MNQFETNIVITQLAVLFNGYKMSKYDHAKQGIDIVFNSLYHEQQDKEARERHIINKILLNSIG